MLNKKRTTNLLHSFLCIGKTLLGKGADVESRNEYNNTLLAHSAKRGQTKEIYVSSISYIPHVACYFVKLTSGFVQIRKAVIKCVSVDFYVLPLSRLYSSGEHKLIQGARRVTQP